MNRILRNEIENIAQYLLIKLPDQPLWPQEFQELNKIHLKDTMNKISEKTIFIEELFHYVIKLIIYRVNDKYYFKSEDTMYDFFNITKALEEIKDTDGEAKRNGTGFVQNWNLFSMRLACYHIYVPTFFVTNNIFMHRRKVSCRRPSDK